MQDAAAISRTARVIDALEQAERIEQLINDAIAVERSDRPSASQLLDEAIAATRELPDLHELHPVGAFPTPAELAVQLDRRRQRRDRSERVGWRGERVECRSRRDTRGGAKV